MAGSKTKIRARVIEFYDDAAADVYEKAREDLHIAHRDYPDRIADAQKELYEALKQLRATVTSYRFEALPRSEYRAILEAHPPTEADHERVKADGDAGEALWSVEGFPRALVQACCVDPKLSNSDIADLFDKKGRNDAEVAYLFAGAYEVNTKRRVVEL